MTDPVHDEENLTPAAEGALSEFVDDFRRALIRRASVGARRAGADVVTVSDVARAYDSLSRHEGYASQRRSRAATLLAVYAALGVALTAGSGIVLLLRYTQDSSSTDRLIAIIAAVGVFVSALSALGTLTIRRARIGGLEITSYPSRDLEGDFIRAWAGFEIDAKTALGDVLGESAVARMTLNELFERLAAAGLLTSDDVGTLRRVLRSRNAIVHGASADPNDIANGLKELERLAARLIQPS